MSENPEDKKEGNTELTNNVVAEFAKVVPAVYKDAIQPAAKEIGKSLETITETVNVLLSPLKGLVWGYGKIEEFVSTTVSEKLRNTPKNEIVPPKPNVAGPVLEALRYAGYESSLRDLYANLLASSMDLATASTAHPGFVEILKQLTPDEAKLLKLFCVRRAFPLINLRAELKDGRGGNFMLINFSTLGEEAGCENAELTPIYLDNLCRLGVIEIPKFFEYTVPNIYDQLENHVTVLNNKRLIEAMPNQKSIIQRKGAQVTQLGKLFIDACVVDYASKRSEIPSK